MKVQIEVNKGIFCYNGFHFEPLDFINIWYQSEAATRGVLYQKVFLEISQNS